MQWFLLPYYTLRLRPMQMSAMVCKCSKIVQLPQREQWAVAQSNRGSPIKPTLFWMQFCSSVKYMKKRQNSWTKSMRATSKTPCLQLSAWISEVRFWSHGWIGVWMDEWIYHKNSSYHMHRLLSRSYECGTLQLMSLNLNASFLPSMLEWELFGR